MNFTHPWKSLLLLALTSTFLMQCKDTPGNGQTEEVTMESVMAVHDEVMPKMTDISKLVAELKPIADTAAAGDPHRKAMEDLQAAHKSMMDWMKGFGDNFNYEEINKGKALTAEKQVILEEEALKVEAMRSQVEASLAQAREVLGKE
ncbi:hypothetical protein SAMN04490243_1363 [Robiginitalea myxolifaciens]|uniref:Viral A-type inclusion protein n=1 Tax=Robiginitalea myxolifaciens TaxID=400055 RepID=A0A1I6G7Q2_9FLAO|nr:hypothetical protein [Robiginitalea myxolifaciens]SFR38214.1 hypothetical protein SAMN04490243_1363 [Robiginitalea myxolifaciens]